MQFSDVGPLQVLVVGFDADARFDGLILEELERLITRGTIRMIDLRFVTRVDDGTVAELELDALSEDERAGFGQVIDALRGLAGQSDGVVDGEIWLETKVKSQKAVNLRRDPRFTFMIEDGDTYDTLRGVSFEGTSEIIDDPDTVFRVGVSVWERYTGPYSDEMKPAVDMMMNKRVAVRLNTTRTRSWDHRKLGMPAMPVAGSTAPAQ